MKLPKIAIWGPIAWILLLFSIGEWRRLELWGLVVAILVLSSARDWTKRLYRGLIPVLLVGLFYDAMRFVKQVGLAPERVHSCDLQAFEARWFGLANGETVHPWLQAHAHPALDVLAAIPYGTFLLASFACAALWRVKRTRTRSVRLEPGSNSSVTSRPSSGQLDSMLSKVADFFEREVDDAVAGLSQLLEPIIMVFLGVVIGGLVVAMYLPIFKLGAVV